MGNVLLTYRPGQPTVTTEQREEVARRYDGLARIQSTYSGVCWWRTSRQSPLRFT
jgi:hypothetical protein